MKAKFNYFIALILLIFPGCLSIGDRYRNLDEKGVAVQFVVQQLNLNVSDLDDYMEASTEYELYKDGGKERPMVVIRVDIPLKNKIQKTEYVIITDGKIGVLNLNDVKLYVDSRNKSIGK